MRCSNYRIFCPTGLHLSRGEVCERCVGGREWNCVVRNCEDNWAKSVGYAARTAFARLTRAFIDNVTLFIVQSEFQKNKFAERGIPLEQLEILPNPAPVVPLDRSECVGDYVGFVGRLSAEKGIGELMEAIQLDSDIPFLAAGHIRKPIGKKDQFPANFSTAGYLRDDELDAFYANSRILVFPSKWYEGFPNSLIAAMAWGKPVVASRIGALAEIVEDGVTGLLVEPGNGADLAAKIGDLWMQPDRCRDMGHRAAERARNLYSEEFVSCRVGEIIAKACSMGAVNG